ncbi:hypothetical protein O3P69_014491 [Scylla paramamosain]|uniref:Uncharacterized protein n=1 Tax=Scylla paramamosain TaxID=85552 RepID=A0AAW0TC63_SCYPA
MIILKEHVQARQSLHRSRKAFVSPHRPIQTREGLGPPRRSRGVCFTDWSRCLYQIFTVPPHRQHRTKNYAPRYEPPRN